MISNDYLKQFSDFQANLFRPVARYNEIAAKLTEELTSNSIRTLNKVLEEYQNGFKAYSEIKKWEDFLAIQTALTDKTATDLLEATQKCSQIMVEAMSDMSKLMQENYEKASAPIKAATPFKKSEGKN
jgi:phasin family protein